MRSCLLGMLLIVLLAANGYVIYQLHHLHQQVDALQRQVELSPRRAPAETSLSEHVSAAQEALRRGDIVTARRELGEFMTEAGRLQALAVEQKDELLRLAAQAQQTLEQKSDTARTSLERLLQCLEGDEESKNATKKE